MLTRLLDKSVIDERFMSHEYQINKEQKCYRYHIVVVHLFIKTPLLAFLES